MISNLGQSPAFMLFTSIISCLKNVRFWFKIFHWKDFSRADNTMRMVNSGRRMKEQLSAKERHNSAPNLGGFPPLCSTLPMSHNFFFRVITCHLVSSQRDFTPGQWWLLSLEWGLGTGEDAADSRESRAPWGATLSGNQSWPEALVSDPRLWEWKVTS